MTVSFDGELVAALEKIAVCFEEQSSYERKFADETTIEVATMLGLGKKRLIQALNLAYGA
jgi:hypothetical protein